MNITYDPSSGFCYPDGNIDQAFKNHLECGDNPVIGQELFITRARLGLRRGEIDSLTITYKGEEYPVNPDGTIDDWGDIPSRHLDLLIEMVD